MDTSLETRMSAMRIASGVRWAPEYPQGGAALDRSTIRARLLIALSAICVIAMLVAGIAGARDCRAPPIRMVHGQESSLSATVPANGSCILLIDPGSATVDALHVVAAPAHGRLEPRGRTGIVYRPQQGFTGEDQFDLSLEAGGGRGTSTIRMRVAVR